MLNHCRIFALPSSAILLFVSEILVAPCTFAEAADPTPDYTRQIRPLLANRCLGCHGADPKTRKAGLRLDDLASATSKLESGSRAISPGKPDTSELIARIATDDEFTRMPPPESGKPLSAEEQNLLKRWIADGAKYQRHWAFDAPKQSALPIKLSKPRWVRHPIDRFVMARLDHEGLQPAPEADRYTIIRRLSLDLTGLPPSIDEVDRFVADKSPKAYENMVDRLLESTAYGERWARVWLDLARYADSAGYAQDPARTIWRFRDWVIQSLNANLPFDEFTVQQIAGDMLPNPTENQLLATAFHRNTMTNSEGGTDDEEFRNAAIVDRVDTTMQVWMGMTMGCARCHSHKFDPISQNEYFQFFAILNNTEDADRPNESPTLLTMTSEQDKQKAALQVSISELEIELKKEAKTQKTTPTKQAGPLSVRFIRVELPGKQVFLSLAEVEVFVGKKNVARTGAATQISVDFNGPAKLAIDGNTSGEFAEAKSTTHTAAGDNPWWEVDLGKSQNVDRVQIWNRTDGEVGVRLKNFRVIALDEKRRPLWVTTVAAPPSPNVPLTLPKKSEDLTAKQQTELAAYSNANSPEKSAAQKRLAALKKKLAGIKGIPTPIMRELLGDKRRTTRIQLRGNFKVTAEVVEPGVPSEFHPLPDGAAANRLTLARWLVDKKNPLTARVVVNRYWEQLFGIGIVETSEDFGTQGELPSHPELLDYLAVELMKNGWDVKQLIREIVSSATYRQSSRMTSELRERDPHNRLLAHGPRFRLSAEMIRDQSLAVSGLLSRKMYGPSVRPPRPNLGLRAAFGGSTDWKPSPGDDKFRRGLYTSWRRTTPYPSMATFDAPSREVCTIRRIRTNTPLQALVTLNDPAFIEAAQALARRMVSEGGQSARERASYGFRLSLARSPSHAELDVLVKLYEQSLARFDKDREQATALATTPIGPLPKGMDAAELAAWTVVSNILMNLDEFVARP
jgi:hypothetical protein